jgi:hypothetical protein
MAEAMSITAITRHRLGSCLATVLLAASFLQAAPVQDKPLDTTTAEYSDLLDTIFPRDLDGTLFAFAFRLEPGTGVESQLVVKVLPDRRVSAELSQVTGRSASDSLSDMRRRGRRGLSIAELAKSVTVIRRPVNVDLKTVQDWQLALLSAAGVTTQKLEAVAREDQRAQATTLKVVADGFAYRLWYAQGMATAHWSFVDLDPENAEMFPTPLLPLIRWIEDVMNTAEQRVRPEQVK